jgi:methyl-accepting chemotaxis protein
VVNQAINAMKEIGGASNKISDIIGVIDEIAFQTNLLALNAAVEAARAGEQGRGFAVVASEVRSLAQRSAGAAKEIKELINDSVKKVAEGTRLVDNSGETLEGIMTSIQSVLELISNINTASQEQATGINHVNAAISQMDTMTQQNAALVEETSAVSASMNTEASKLQELMRFFK